MRGTAATEFIHEAVVMREAGIEHPRVQSVVSPGAAIPGREPDRMKPSEYFGNDFPGLRGGSR